MPEESSRHLKDMPTFGIIKSIRDGTLDPHILPKATRQDCVEVLIQEGQSIPAIANLLNCSDRTISRCVHVMWRSNYGVLGNEKKRELIGEYIARTRNGVSYLMRLARSKETDPTKQAQIELLASQLYGKMLDRLAALGYSLSELIEDDGKPMLCQKEEVAKKESHADRAFHEAFNKLPPYKREMYIKKFEKVLLDMQMEILGMEDPRLAEFKSNSDTGQRG